MTHAPAHPHKGITRWLVITYLMIFLMVIIGGITRLTGSGLSMVDWHPLMGALPPLNDADWMAVFEHYKQSPQYQLVNHWMGLEDFKSIFLWEYLHRLWGRLIGLVFFIPWLVFLIRKRMDRPLAIKTFIAFILGGLQGLLGWYMVKSGLVDVPEVSHYRLAAHLGLALFLGNYILWLILDRGSIDDAPTMPRGVRRMAWALLVLIALQMFYGALMAGKQAGVLFSTFPDMQGAMVPKGMGSLSPIWLNLVENPITIHFIHRVLGWLVLFGAMGFFLMAQRHARGSRQHLALNLLLILPILQFLLGVATVVMHVPVSIAVVHQAGGTLLLSAAVFAAHTFSRRGHPA